MNRHLLLTPALFLGLFLVTQSGCRKESSISTVNSTPGISFIANEIQVLVDAENTNEVLMNIYKRCDSEKPELSIALKNVNTSEWFINLSDTLNGYLYDFTLIREGNESRSVVDPYVKAVCANGNRGALLDPGEINPENWAIDNGPAVNPGDPVILYELHVRDFSMDSSAKSEFPGKYLAFTEEREFGLEYIRKLGVTHIHLLPVFDFASIDETSEAPSYNWGYDPQNYFVPEGSYSTEPAAPDARIMEFKKMVQAMHDKSLGVIMDVVYNHTYYLDNSSFQVWAPGTYYRQWEDGTYSNASACGNELATENEKVRQMIIESLKYWMKEYHIDGFRFDLMGIMDIPTMQKIERELRSINPDVILYGEGWLAGDSPLPDTLRATKANMAQIPGIAAFSDEIRDGIKGHWSDEKDKGFVSGKKGMIPSVQFGIAGGIEHPQIDYSRVNNSDKAWAENPVQLISYVSCHDNHTLWDKLEISAGEYSEDNRRKMHLLAQSMVLTSQGISFLHAGTEFFRSKFGDHNSFESPDSINRIRWYESNKHPEAVNYIRDLIAFRKDHPVFRLQTAQEVQQRLRFYDSEDDKVLIFELNAEGIEESVNRILCVFVPQGAELKSALPEGNWKVAFQNFKKTPLADFDIDQAQKLGPNALILIE